MSIPRTFIVALLLSLLWSFLGSFYIPETWGKKVVENAYQKAIKGTMECEVQASQAAREGMFISCASPWQLFEYPYGVLGVPLPSSRITILVGEVSPIQFKYDINAITINTFLFLGFSYILLWLYSYFTLPKLRKPDTDR